MPRAKVLSIINYKGGVGKTTTTYHVGCSLAQHHNKKVLLIDIDPQTNLTFLCAIPERWERFKRNTGTIATMYRRFQDRVTLDPKRYIWRTPIRAGRYVIPNLDLIPCDIDLLGEDLGGGRIAGTFPTIEALRRQTKEFLRERTFLRNAIREVEDDYDYVLIDCPPNLYLMTQNALVASDWYIITAIPDHLSTIGLSILQRKVSSEVGSGENSSIAKLVESAQTFAGSTGSPMKVADCGGVIFVKVRIGGSRITTTHSAIMEELNSTLGRGICFSPHTTELIGYGEAAEFSVPVWMHTSQNARRATEKREYENITDEFVRRFQGL